MLVIRSRHLLHVILAVALSAFSSASAFGQLSDILSGGPLGSGDGLQGGLSAESPDEIVSVFAHFTPPVDGRPAMLSITAHIEDPWYTYSTTQPPHGATPTRITVSPADDFRITGEFHSTLPPKIVRDGGFTLKSFPRKSRGKRRRVS